MSFDLDVALKSAQILFYLTAGVVATLTFISAKNGLLNTVNTEYHKKIIERLYAVSEDLYEEFDSLSSRFWARDNSSKELVDGINEQVRDQKEMIIGSLEVDPPFGIPHVKIISRFQNLSNKYRSDPFLPEPIRTEVVSLFQARADAMLEAHMEVAQYYFKRLTRGECWDDLEGNEGWIHNMIVERMYNAGVGVSQVEKRMHEVRLQIQEYFSQFNPLRRYTRELTKRKT